MTERNTATRPTFRTDNVGSFLRPSYLLDARHRDLPPDQLRPIEDRAIADVVKMQEEVGISVVTDGEFRRKVFFSTVVAVADGFDPVGYERFHRDAAGNVEKFGAPTPVAKLKRKGTLVDLELSYVRQLTQRPIKVTMPSPSLMVGYWKDGVSDKAYPSKEAFLDDLIAIMNADAKALAAAGAAYLQIDAPQYTYVSDPAIRPDVKDPAAELRRMISTDNRVFEGVRGVTTGLHLCRGNYKSKFTGTKPYEEFAEVIFEDARFDRLLLEYDDDRAGGFEPLRFTRSDTTVVLGLVTTKAGKLEKRDDLVRRIEAASKYVSIDRLALSTQCGFASVDEGNLITEDAQRAKLELIVSTADHVWKDVRQTLATAVG